MSEHEQRTDAWHQARLGNVTASSVYKVMARTKTGYGADRHNYLAQLVTERLTGQSTDFFVNDAMRRGTELEPQARALYSLEVTDDVIETGYVPHPLIDRCGASPDGLVGERGLVEIKVPNTWTHIETLRGGPIPRQYMLQMQLQLACTERDWCDFASFDPRLPAPMQLHIRRVERDDDLLVEIETEVEAFLAEIEATVADLEARYMMEAA